MRNQQAMAQCDTEHSCRNLTELAEVAVNVTSYLHGLPLALQAGVENTTSGPVSFLVDHPDCGLRNNDTFNLCPSSNPNSMYCLPYYGGLVTANWTAECLWDCTWKDNPYRGQRHLFDGVDIVVTMAKIPIDLRCLDGCTTSNFPTHYQKSSTSDPLVRLNCSTYPDASFLGCYLKFTSDSLVPWSASSYFDMAVESCVLAVLQRDVYPNGTCEQLGVNLVIRDPENGVRYVRDTASNDGGISSAVAAAERASNADEIPLKNRYPWLCSLRIPGYAGAHRCGVTLISGPPQPTIFVSAAHCNYLCKNTLGRTVEICCCLNGKKFSCKGSDFCGPDPTYQLAKASDLQIACNVPVQVPLPHGYRNTNTTLFTIQEIRNHPKYVAFNEAGNEGGPIGGHDISVYIVDDSKLKMHPSSIWPACLPKAEDLYLQGSRGILAGWIEPLPAIIVEDQSTSLRTYALSNLWQRQSLYQRVPCADPEWMKSSTYYPPGTACYEGLAWANSLQFGMSGSGIVRPAWDADKESTRFSWAGTLSLSKGADLLVNHFWGLQQYSSNPAVFTDALCHLEWVAAQYHLTLPPTFHAPPSCGRSRGDKADVNKTNCLSRDYDMKQNFNLSLGYNVNAFSNIPERCKFSAENNKCQLYAYKPRLRPATNSNFFTCINVSNKKALCANNCPGVDPNAVVVGGLAATFSLAAGATAVGASGSSLLGPAALGAGSLLAMMGLGNLYNMAACPRGQCRARIARRCCDTVLINGRSVCPLLCN